MDVKTFRDNLFSMNTRRFGRVCELLIQELIDGGHASSIHYDIDCGGRVEVKFSRVGKVHNTPINEENVLEVIEGEGLAVRLFPFGEWRQHEFDCNIQQVKKSEFDVLFYGLLFADCVAVFVAEVDQIGSEMRYSNKQHKGNIGEGQFHINNSTFQYHLDNHLCGTLSYTDVMKILQK
ncbi:hypothetical protein CHCC14819_0492 [Bacillus licheniformis]|uniref:hypothetical protein n=1 Tax=Bacillus licheniformis TaxID=1402 RepID=UPI0011A633CC|nr:hypothetical protein [Bacillus licheniformis]TWM32296.1 hypothetical protein CHCC14819_0492 [Bacillus licheniformis]